MKILLAGLCLFLLSAPLFAKPDSLSYTFETGGFASVGKRAPFWLYSNQFGVFSLNKNSAYVRAFLKSEENAQRHFDLN
jgi:hypothetical protein